MSVFVSHHAIARFQERFFGLSVDDKEAESFLKGIISQGHTVRRRAQNNPYPVYEIEHGGHAVVAEVRPDMISVITYLGDAAYRCWWQRHESCSQRKPRKRCQNSLQTA